MGSILLNANLNLPNKKLMPYNVWPFTFLANWSSVFYFFHCNKRVKTTNVNKRRNKKAHN